MSPGGTGAKPQTKKQMKTPRYVPENIPSNIFDRLANGPARQFEVRRLSDDELVDVVVARSSEEAVNAAITLGHRSPRVVEGPEDKTFVKTHSVIDSNGTGKIGGFWATAAEKAEFERGMAMLAELG